MQSAVVIASLPLKVCCVQLCSDVKGAWGTDWCINISKMGIDRHEQSEAHVRKIAAGFSAQTLEAAKVRADLSGNATQRDGLRSAFRIVYWLAKHRVANHHFPDLRELTVLEGNKGFQTLTKRNAQYYSSTFFTEALQAIGEVLRFDIVSAAKESRHFAIAIDETADLAVIEQLAVYIRFVEAETGKIRVHLFDVIALEKADGESILAAVLESLTTAKLELKRLSGAASDGAGAMAGKEKGSMARLRNLQRFVITVHCICHRLG